MSIFAYILRTVILSCWINEQWYRPLHTHPRTHSARRSLEKFLRSFSTKINNAHMAAAHSSLTQT